MALLHVRNQYIRTLIVQGCLARKKKELDSMQPGHLTVLSVVNDVPGTTKEKDNCRNTIRVAVLHMCSYI